MVLPLFEQQGRWRIRQGDRARTHRPLGYALRVSPNHFDDPLTRPCTSLLKWSYGRLAKRDYVVNPATILLLTGYSYREGACNWTPFRGMYEFRHWRDAEPVRHAIGCPPQPF
jgi:hypothetical protein